MEKPAESTSATEAGGPELEREGTPGSGATEGGEQAHGPEGEPADDPALIPQSFGRYLTQQRELRAMRLQDVARVTRVALEHLTALEGDRFDDLPGEVFAVGYIRSYARCIGLNPDEAVLRFQEVRRAAASGNADAGGQRRNRSWIWMTLAAVVLAGGGAALLFLHH